MRLQCQSCREERVVSRFHRVFIALWALSLSWEIAALTEKRAAISSLMLILCFFLGLPLACHLAQ